MGATKTDKDDKANLHVPLSQIIPVMIMNIMLVTYGMTVGYPTILIPSLSNPLSDEDISLDEEQISWIGSIGMLSLPVGCVLSGIIAQAIGRKRTMQIGSVLVILCWIVFLFCNDVWQIYLALFILGLTAGLIESPVLTYVAEITQPSLRGALLSSGSLSITLGILIEFLLGSVFDWRTVSLYSAIPPLAFIVVSFFLPESPYWLIMKNKTEEARKNLAWFRGWTSVEDVRPEFENISAGRSDSDQDHSDKCYFKLDDYTKLQFIHPFLLVCFIFCVYHFSGLYTIQVNAVKIFETLEVPINEYDATVILGVVQFLGCLVCVFVISYVGKRFLTFSSIVIAVIGITIVATYAYLGNINYLYSTNEVNEKALENYKWVPLAFMFIAIFALNCGIRNLPWNLAVEVFPTETRATATGALGAIFYFIGFASNKVFLDTVAAITLPGVFWLYAALGVISLAILYFWLPETEGKTLSEIIDHFAGIMKLDNKVKRKNEVDVYSISKDVV